jgi:hypothetical protein
MAARLTPPGSLGFFPTRSSAAARGLTGAWTSNLRLEVPETGVSIGEVSRLMRDRFGHDVHIDSQRLPGRIINRRRSDPFETVGRVRGPDTAEGIR